MVYSLNQYIENAIKNNWEKLALSDLNGPDFKYSELAENIAKLHLLFQHSGITAGDKIALCGKNSSQWAMALLATLTYGAVAVPILNGFKADAIHYLVNHSDAKLLFTDSAIWATLEPSMMDGLEGAILIDDYSLLISRSEILTEAHKHVNDYFSQAYPDQLSAYDIRYHADQTDELALINYTSGSTGNPKGVMLTYGNLWSNILFSIEKLTFLLPGDSMICMLPLAHMYGLLVELLHPLAKGCHIYFLTRTPSPKILIDAFASVRPKLIITVPLIIEKIIKNNVFPVLNKPMMKILMRIPGVNSILLSKIKARLKEIFGGNLKELIVGGAALNKDVEAFLRRISFPYTVGYGMTECAPLIAYCPWHKLRPASCGRLVDRMEMRIDSPDPVNIPGELWLKGANVMKGYYKNSEATDLVFRDGWMNTGDLCNIDTDGYIYIRGRNKNMILGASGQNIYPEEIEQKLNNMPYVNESIVIDEDNALVALVYPDIDSATTQGIPMDELEAMIQDNIKKLNSELPAYSQINRLKVVHEEFEKTPKRSIKRFLYQHN